MSLLKSISSNVKIIQDKILTIVQENVSNSKLVHAKDFLDEKMNTLWLRAKQFNEELPSKPLLKINLSEIDSDTKWKVGAAACLAGLLGASAIYNIYAGSHSDSFRDNLTNPIDAISSDDISQNVPDNIPEMKDSSSSAIPSIVFPEFSVLNSAIALGLIGAGAIILNRMSREKKPQELIGSDKKLHISAPEENGRQQTAEDKKISTKQHQKLASNSQRVANWFYSLSAQIGDTLPGLSTPPESDDESEEESEDGKPLLLIYPDKTVNSESQEEQKASTTSNSGSADAKAKDEKEEKEPEKPLLLTNPNTPSSKGKADKKVNPERQEEQKAGAISNSIPADAKVKDEKEEKEPEKPLLLTDANTTPSKDRTDKTVSLKVQKEQEKTKTTSRKTSKSADATLDKGKRKGSGRKPNKGIILPSKGKADKTLKQRGQKALRKNSKATDGTEVKKKLDKKKQGEKESGKPLLLKNLTNDANKKGNLKGEEKQKVSISSLRNSMQVDVEVEEPLLLNLWSPNDIYDDLAEIFMRSQEFMEKYLPPPSFEKPRGSISEYFYNKFNKSYAKASNNQEKINYDGSLPYDDNIYAPNELHGIKVGEYFYNASKIHIGKDCYICAQRPKKPTLENYWKAIILGNVSFIVSFSIDMSKIDLSKIDREDYSLNRSKPLTIKGIGKICQQTEDFEFQPDEYENKTIRIKKCTYQFEPETDKLSERMIVEYELVADSEKSLTSYDQLFDSLQERIDLEWSNENKEGGLIAKRKEGPLFVHCNTGNVISPIFIVVNSLRQQIKKQIDEGKDPIVNFEELLNELRKQRYGIVQSEHLLKLVYEKIKTYAEFLRNQKTPKPAIASMEMVTS